MNDLISRESAVRAIMDYAVGHTFNSFFKGMSKAADIVKGIQPSRQWIPCTERLPGLEEEVLTCTTYGDIEFQSLETSHRGHGMYWADREGNMESIGEVVAWMPVPEAYVWEKGE